MIYACMSWYRESPTWLTYTVASAARFCDHLIAVDGAYALYPDRPRGSSGADEHEAIARACNAAGIGFTLHVPSGPWLRNEVGKRQAMTELFVQLGRPGDWCFVIDADEVVIEAPPKDRLLAQLAESEHPVGLISFGQRHDHYEWQPLDGSDVAPEDRQWPEDRILYTVDGVDFTRSRTRRLFRWDPTLRVEGVHYGYRITDEHGQDVELWQLPGAAAAEDVSNLLVEHRHKFRLPNRREMGESYYARREAAKIETLAPLRRPARGDG